MKRFLVLTMLAAMTTYATSLRDGEINEGVTGDGSTATARIWDLGGGLSMTVAGFSLIGSTFTAANTTQFGLSNIGLGVCGVTPGSVESCTFNQWQMDNAGTGGRDFVLFTFSSAVDLINFSVRQTGLTLRGNADSDWSYATSTGTPGPGSGSLTFASLTNVNGPILAPGSIDVRTIAGANGILSLLVGVGPVNDGCSTQALSSCDYFKLNDINVRASSAVPEPASMALLGAGLIGLGLLSRRRRKQ